MNKEESIDRILELQRDLMLKDIDYNFEYIVDKRIKELQQENKQLKEELKKEKAKNNKAIEYIKHSQSYGTMAQVMPHLKPYVNGDDLLEILGDKE